MAVLSGSRAGDLGVFFLCCMVAGVWSRPSGAPTTACTSMLPNHGTTSQDAATSPFTVTADAVDFTPQQVITVTVTGTVLFRGVLLEARVVGTDIPVGVFGNIPDGFQSIRCTNDSDAVTHSDQNNKISLVVEWTAPGDAIGNIEFIVTVAYTKEIFWALLRSQVITALPDVCASQPCQNGGTCYKTSDKRSYFCGCPTQGTLGPNCEDPCMPNPCQNSGICVVAGNTFSCFCPADRHGDRCEYMTVACNPNPCLNNASCLPTATGHECICATGWSGDDCGTSLICQDDSCLNGGTCFDSNPPGSIMFHCACDVVFTGSRCETADPCRADPCANSGTCYQIDDTVNFNCSCVDGFEGDRCETTTNPCQMSPCTNGGSCFLDSTGDPVCQCPSDYTGDVCQTRMHPCMLSVTPCLNGGTCFHGNGSAYACQCPTGYSGAHCETVDNCELNNQCRGGSTCRYISEGVTQCVCPDGLAGTFCEIDISCSANPCRNGGTCDALGDGTYQCNCQAIYSGIHCEVYTDPCTPEHNPCDHGSCTIILDPDAAYRCTCDDNYSGVNCTIFNGNPCEVFECLNDGECVDNDQGPTCVCGPDYAGQHCERFINPVIIGCPSGLMVAFPLEAGSNRAYVDLVISARDQFNNSIALMVTDGLVFPGFVTFKEEYREGKNIIVQATDADDRTSMCSFHFRIYDPCESFECLNNGECVNNDQGPTCVCAPDYAGEHCETFINPCESFECLNNGECVNNDQGPTCVCAPDYAGEHCERFIKSVCTASTAPDNGVSTCFVDEERQKCSVSCNESFGNALGVDEYMCVSQTPAYWHPRPNTDICVPFKPGNGASRVVSLRFSLESALCNTPDFEDAVVTTLTVSLQALGVCSTDDAVSCGFDLTCGGSGTGRRRRANADLNVGVALSSPAGEGNTTDDVEARLGEAVVKVKAGAATASLSIEVGGETITNEPTALGESDTTWDCKPGQVSRPNGCLSCPPGSFYDTGGNACRYCPDHTFQNKPVQEKCEPCSQGLETQQDGAFSANQCMPVEKDPLDGTWTPTLIGIVGGVGGLIVILLVIVACVVVIKCSHKSSGDSKDGPQTNFTHLNKAYENTEDFPEMQFHGVDGDNTYQNIMNNGDTPTGSTDHLVRIPSLSQYSDYYATLNARSAPNLEPETPPPPPPVSPPEPPAPQLNGEAPQLNGGPPSPPPAPPVPPAPDLNTNNSNSAADHTYMNGSSRANFHV